MSFWPGCLKKKNQICCSLLRTAEIEHQKQGLHQSVFRRGEGQNPALQWCFPARGVAAATPRPHVASPLVRAFL